MRLSPFLLDDFMASLQSEEVTPLLAKVHIQLLKEGDGQQKVFGPMRNSINSILMFGDTLTWPQVMRTYFQSDPIFAPALSLLESCEYPFATADVRLRLLKFLTDQFLCNTAVHKILSDGKMCYYF